MTAPYLRFPSLHGSVVAFAAEEGIRLVLEALERRPAATPPDPATRPSLVPPPLPGRP